MRSKTAAFLILLLFTASVFAVTSTVFVMADNSPDIDTGVPGSGGGPIGPCDGDDVPGGGGGGP